MNSITKEIVQYIIEDEIIAYLQEDELDNFVNIITDNLKDVSILDSGNVFRFKIISDDSKIIHTGPNFFAECLTGEVEWDNSSDAVKKVPYEYIKLCEYLWQSGLNTIRLFGAKNKKTGYLEVSIILSKKTNDNFSEDWFL